MAIQRLLDSQSNPVTVVAGDDLAVTVTLTDDGSAYPVTGGTITASVMRLGGTAKLLEGVSLSISDGANGVVLLTLTESQTAQLAQPPAGQQDQTITHIVDVQSVVSGQTLHHGPFTFRVRRPVT